MPSTGVLDPISVIDEFVLRARPDTAVGAGDRAIIDAVRARSHVVLCVGSVWYRISALSAKEPEITTDHRGYMTGIQRHEVPL